MGSHKHGIHGHAPKSPRLKHAIKREAEKDVRKRRDLTKWVENVSDVFDDKNKT